MQPFNTLSPEIPIFEYFHKFLWNELRSKKVNFSQGKTALKYFEIVKNIWNVKF